MVYFSRLTDIVTCNLSEILSKEAKPDEALRKIIAEMEEGLAGAQRSVTTAAASQERLRKEIDDHRGQLDKWSDRARRELAAGNDDQARAALERKQETLDVLAGLEQQHKAATATRDHLTTTLKALEARLAEARRRLFDLGGEPAGGAGASARGGRAAGTSADAAADRARRIDAELEALKRELGRG